MPEYKQVFAMSKLKRIGGLLCRLGGSEVTVFCGLCARSVLSVPNS